MRAAPGGAQRFFLAAASRRVSRATSASAAIRPARSASSAARSAKAHPLPSRRPSVDRRRTFGRHGRRGRHTSPLALRRQALRESRRGQPSPRLHQLSTRGSAKAGPRRQRRQRTACKPGLDVYGDARPVEGNQHSAKCEYPHPRKRSSAVRLRRISRVVANRVW